ncbi:MAG: ADP-ribosylglycohydrolase family protein [Oscillospiraceae bacterium]|nr:ADP-ribosylglycohydrolase family protein [Oscillospiraceae bacterium]
MWGAVYGDIIGSYYEVHSTKNFNFPFQSSSTFTDDTVMTAAVCEAICRNNAPITSREVKKRAKEYAAQYKRFYSLYPNAGFGQMFSEWAEASSLYRQSSFGNGAAMRVVPIGYAYDTLEQTLLQAKASCLYTHYNKEAIMGAQAVAAAVWLARHGKSKDEIKSYLEANFRYYLSVPISEIREDYGFEVRAGKSVPQSIAAFLQSEDYESVVRNAVSLGGDADTMACIAGGIAEAFYREIPQSIKNFCDLRLVGTIKRIVNSFIEAHNGQNNGK